MKFEVHDNLRLRTLHTVANSSRCPTKEKAASTSFLEGEFETIAQGLVLFLVDLESALDQIEGCHQCVSETTGKKTTEATKGKILWATKLARVLFGGGCSLDHSFFGHFLFDQIHGY